MTDCIRKQSLLLNYFLSDNNLEYNKLLSYLSTKYYSINNYYSFLINALSELKKNYHFNYINKFIQFYELIHKNLLDNEIILSFSLWNFLSTYNIINLKQFQNEMISIISINKIDQGIDIDWKVNILDEYEGWFIGKAVKYYDSIQSIEIIVENSSNFIVKLDPRLIKLIKCYDKLSSSFFDFIKLKDPIQINWKILYKNVISLPKTTSFTYLWKEGDATVYFPYINCIVYKDSLNCSNQNILHINNNIILISNNDDFSNILSFKYFQYLERDFSINLSTESKIQLESFQFNYKNNKLYENNNSHENENEIKSNLEIYDSVKFVFN